MLLNYALVSALILCCGYLCYRWVMADERQHSYNRVILYVIYAAALLLPIAILSDGAVLKSPTQPAMIEIGALTPVSAKSRLAVNDAPEWLSFSWIAKALVMTYLAGVVIMVLVSISGLIALLREIRRGEVMPAGKYGIVITDNSNLAPFSWLRYIVMTQADYAEAGNVIMEHEKCHLRMHHWIDLLVAQAVICLQWFNPAAWLMRSELRTVHEYQADEAVIKSGADISGYQKMLIKKAVGSRFQSFANSLNHSKLKKRVTMMYKEKSSAARRFGALLLAPALAAGCFATAIPAVARVLDSFAQVSFATDTERKVNENFEIEEIIDSELLMPRDVKDADPVMQEVVSEEGEGQIIVEEREPGKDYAMMEAESLSDGNAPSEMVPSDNNESAQDNDADEKPVLAPDKPAQYPDDLAALMKYLAGEIKYPEEAVKNNEEGMVLVKFVIEADGSVGDVEIVKSVSSSLDAEALRVVKGMKKWTPGMVKGKPVASWFHLPIKFKLPEEKGEKK